MTQRAVTVLTQMQIPRFVLTAIVKRGIQPVVNAVAMMEQVMIGIIPMELVVIVVLGLVVTVQMVQKTVARAVSIVVAPVPLLAQVVPAL